jgi:hypothetical protein
MAGGSVTVPESGRPVLDTSKFRRSSEAMRLAVLLFCAVCVWVVQTVRHDTSTPYPDQAVILPDNADEEARNATPVQEPITAIAATAGTVVTLDSVMASDFSSTV